MTGKELILKALNHEETPRPAWLPFVGVHGGSLINTNASEYLQSSELILQGLTRAKSLYKPDGLPIVFDLQLEAEILGCELHWANEVPPSVISHPLETKSVADLPPLDASKGRFPIVIDALQKFKAEDNNETAIYGLITGPFTLCLHLMGNNIFIDMFDNEDKVKEVMSYCARIGKKSADIYLDNGADVIAVVDPMTSQISPDHFNDFVTPFVNEVFDHIKSRGAHSSLFVCGDATRVLPEMCETNCDNISVDENIDLAALKTSALASGKSFGGNLKLTTVLLLGTEDDAKRDALRCIDIGENKSFILAPGCDLPYAVPEENLIAVSEMIHDEYKRDIARNIFANQTNKNIDNFDDVELPDYSSRAMVIVDVITLDSKACAPCQYMMAAAKESSEQFESDVVVREHKIKNRRGLGYMQKLGVKNIPTVCIDGEAKFISIIPDQSTLSEALRNRLSAKGIDQNET